MFGISLPELMIIAFVAVVMFGPERMPELARSAARLIKNLRQLAAKTQDDLRRELGPEFADLRLTDLNPREAIRRHVLDGLDMDLGLDGMAQNQTADAEGTLSVDERPPFDVDAT
ncbi:MAG TPA: sec-independent translocase [Marmoricola sp.]|nr:sec-independent translocase [Marmoricola sp.]